MQSLAYLTAILSLLLLGSLCVQGTKCSPLLLTLLANEAQRGGKTTKSYSTLLIFPLSFLFLSVRFSFLQRSREVGIIQREHQWHVCLGLILRRFRSRKKIVAEIIFNYPRLLCGSDACCVLSNYQGSCSFCWRTISLRARFVAIFLSSGWSTCWIRLGQVAKALTDCMSAATPPNLNNAISTTDSYASSKYVFYPNFSSHLQNN